MDESRGFTIESTELWHRFQFEFERSLLITAQMFLCTFIRNQYISPTALFN